MKQGQISDDTCAINPCDNGGTCQITWNDYYCQCTEFFRGRNCTQKKYCSWYKCPSGSTCRSLDDGHECISNATFNGVNSVVVVSPQFSTQVENNTTIEIRYRSRSTGTLLQVSRTFDQFIQLSLTEAGEAISIEVPEKDGTIHTYNVAVNNTDGGWHEFKVKFSNDGVVTVMSDGRDSSTNIETLTLDSSVVNLAEFVEESNIIVGSSHLTLSPGEVYTVSDDDTTLPSLIDIKGNGGTYADHYRGCIGELRIAGVLVPFFTGSELVNNSASARFDVQKRENVEKSNCILCYEDECQNDGTCTEPQEKFDCTCQDGFQGPLCATNIDECQMNNCKHGQCLDGIANYTCLCQPGWTGWLCDEDLDECESTPCLNGGQCQQTNTPGNYTCTCTDKFKGHNCDQPRNRTCDDNPCHNGANCIPKKSK